MKDNIKAPDSYLGLMRYVALIKAYYQGARKMKEADVLSVITKVKPDPMSPDFGLPAITRDEKRDGQLPLLMSGTSEYEAARFEASSRKDRRAVAGPRVRARIEY